MRTLRRKPGDRHEKTLSGGETIDADEAKRLALSKPEGPGCQCTECVGACYHKPGWFLPGEAEKAAEAKDMTLKEFFDQYLAVDWHTAEGRCGVGEVFLLSPATSRIEPGGQFGGDPRGACVFANAGKCSIYDTRPFECRVAWHAPVDGGFVDHAESSREELSAHCLAAKAWDKPEHQAQIRELLGRKPKAAPFHPWSFL